MSDHRLTPFELSCLVKLEQDTASGDDSTSPIDGPSSNTNLLTWDNFEACAHAVALLYRNPNWQTFQTAAASTTQLYKDGVESQRRAFDHGLASGRQRLIKELIVYLRGHHGKSFLRREDFIAFLTGRPTTRVVSTSASPVSRTLGQLCLQSSPTQTRTMRESENPIYMFQEALALQSGGSSPSRTSPPRRVRSELSAFLLDELRQHRKRCHSSSSQSASSSPGAVMSPSTVYNHHHKRFRRY